MNGPGVAAQPTAGLGAKSGAEPDSAALPMPLTNPHTPRAIPKISANFDMGHLAIIGLLSVADDIQPLWIKASGGSIMGLTSKIVLTGVSGIVLGAAGMAALAAQTVAPPAYYVGNVQEVKDAEAYKNYAGKVADTLIPFGGKFVVRGAEPVILDASRKPPGYIVIIQFPSMKNLRDWWNSPVYSSIRPIRERLTIGQNYAVEGMPPS